MNQAAEKIHEQKNGSVASSLQQTHLDFGIRLEDDPAGIVRHLTAIGWRLRLGRSRLRRCRGLSGFRGRRLLPCAGCRMPFGRHLGRGGGLCRRGIFRLCLMGCRSRRPGADRIGRRGVRGCSCRWGRRIQCCASAGQKAHRQQRRYENRCFFLHLTDPQWGIYPSTRHPHCR